MCLFKGVQTCSERDHERMWTVLFQPYLSLQMQVSRNKTFKSIN